MQTPQSPYFRYATAPTFVGLALLLSLLLQGVLSHGFLIFFLSAVMLSGWFGRTGPGLLAVGLSTLVVAYFFIPPYRALAVDIDELPYFLSFLLSAAVTSWLGSARRLAEEKQRAYLDELFEQTPEAILLVDLEHRVLRINRQFTRIFGYEIDEIAGRDSIDLITPPELRKESLRHRDQLSLGHEVSIESVRVRKDGSRLHVSEVSFPVNTDGSNIAYYTIFRDITDRRRAVEDLQKAQSELAHLSRLTVMGELASSIAHEINQPIGAIAINSNAAVRWIAQTPQNLAEAGEALGCIVRDANRAAEVIGRIRALLTKNTTPMISLDVNEVIREVVLVTGHEATRRGARVSTQLTNQLPPVNGDRVQLQQVLLNLIMNGLDAMDSITDRQRALRITSAKEGINVCVRIEDSGQGLDPQQTEFMFDAFFTTKKDGLGMGLTISRSIVETHGGRLWAERREPRGSTLAFTLPMANPS